jgi:hypothetical protein
MNKRIIYPTDDGGVAIIIPAVSVELAMKDIPAGKPYKIVDVADIPTDRTFRNAWEFSEAESVADQPTEETL